MFAASLIKTMGKFRVKENKTVLFHSWVALWGCLIQAGATYYVDEEN